MNWKTSIFLFLVMATVSCKKNNTNLPPAREIDTNIGQLTNTNVNHIIEADELQEILHEPNVKIIHFGREIEYNEGHIEGALNIWRTDIEDASYPYNGMMCSKSQLEELFSKKGIKNSDTLIVYDHVASCDAARLWWVLENYGFQNLKILNGGINGWKEIDGKLTMETTIVEASTFTLPEKSPMTLYVSKEEMLAYMKEEKPPLIIDTRTSDEYTGARQKKGAKSGGRIPESIFLDWADCVNYNGNKKFKDIKVLETMYANVIPNKEYPVVAYCHSGVRSAHTTFVLTELLGYKNVRNYDGSWTEWSQFEHYPKEKDSVTTIIQ